MILDWKKIAEQIYDNLKNKISNLKNKPSLAVILVWDNPASLVYIRQKEKYASYVWINFILKKFKNNIKENILIKEIESLNNDNKISGFIVQLPLPKHINTQKIIDTMDPKKDVDGFTKENIWKLFLNEKSGLISCTPKWIKKLLDAYNIPLKWKNVTIIWKSNIVGKPLSILFINNSATVTVCNIYTKNLKEHTLKSDIIISATWKPGLITKNMIKPGSIIIDVGFSFVNWKTVWDCDFDKLEKENIITPVPWWVGPMTVAMLMENTYLAAINYKKIK